MSGYTKVFTTLLDSTVWQLSKEARILWITMLLKKDGQQMVRAAVPGLAHAARLTIQETEVALKELQKPDRYSQSQEHEGRRVIARDGGWFVVNGAKYRDMLSAESRREYKRQWQAQNRAKKSGKSKPGTGEGIHQRAVERDESVQYTDKLSDPDFLHDGHG
jgi:hypothetical protein